MILSLARAVALIIMAVQAPGEPKNMIREFCGSVVHQQSVPGKKPSSEPKTETKAMRGVQLLTYPYEEGRACCEGMTSVGSAITTRGGKFEFKKLPAGEYWLAIRANGRDASIHVSYEPIQGYKSTCSDYTVTFDDTDKLGLMVTITLD